MADTDYFESIRSLPDDEIGERTKTLVGFEEHYLSVNRNLRLILDNEGVCKWSQKFHETVLPFCHLIADRHPLMIFEGDVGTGKTVTAEGIAERMTRELKKEGFLLKLSTRVRGRGFHGEMSKLIHLGFDRLAKEAGKRRLAFLLIDEADAIASTRAMEQMHQEEKAAVNTLIQKLDDIRKLKGRAMVFLTTNRLDVLDQAIVRRASLRLNFKRPNDNERSQLFSADLDGLKFTLKEIKELSRLTGPKMNDGLGFTFSDIRLRLLPEAVARAYPDKRLTFREIEEAALNLKPSPEIE